MAYEFQSRILNQINTRHQVSLILPMGAGKTRIACLWADNKGLGSKWVICPPVAIPVWQGEIEKWLGRMALVVEGSRQEKITILRSRWHDWLIISYQTFRSLQNFMALTEPPDLAILDESQTIKNPKAQVTKATHAWLKNVAFKAILTGTPTSQSELDLWSQWYFLDKGATFGTSFYGFRQYYFAPDNMGWNWTLKAGMARIINAKMLSTGPIMQEEEIDLPPQTYSRAYVEPSKLQRKHYEAILKEFRTASSRTGETIIDTQWAFVQLLHLRRICCGFLKADDGTVFEMPCEKYATLLGLLDEFLPKYKVVIWTTWIKERALVARALSQKGISHVVYRGGMATKDRREVVRRFQQDDSIKVFLGSVAAGGKAITLSAASRVIYTSNTYSVDTRLQSEKRTHRIGSEIHKRIHYTDILTRGTVEEDILSALQTRKLTNEMLLKRHLLSKLLGEADGR